MNVRDFFKRYAQTLRRKARKRGYTCDNCGAEVFSYPAERLCSACAEKLQRNQEKRCIKCGRKTVTEGVCLTCKNSLPVFTRGFSPFVYRGETAAMINRMKNSAPRLAAYLGEQMAEYFLRNTEGLGSSETPLLAVPVPMTKNKERERGYNQSVFLCEAFCERMEEKGVATELVRDVLVKKKETVAQKHATAKERRENVKGAFRLCKRKIFRGRTVVLIDDILTTGATASECAECLFGAGAQEVLLLVAAALPERK